MEILSIKNVLKVTEAVIVGLCDRHPKSFLANVCGGGRSIKKKLMVELLPALI